MIIIVIHRYRICIETLYMFIVIQLNKYIFGEKSIQSGNYTSFDNNHARAQKLHQKLPNIKK